MILSGRRELFEWINNCIDLLIVLSALFILIVLILLIEWLISGRSMIAKEMHHPSIILWKKSSMFAGSVAVFKCWSSSNRIELESNSFEWINFYCHCLVRHVFLVFGARKRKYFPKKEEQEQGKPIQIQKSLKNLLQSKLLPELNVNSMN